MVGLKLLSFPIIQYVGHIRKISELKQNIKTNICFSDFNIYLYIVPSYSMQNFFFPILILMSYNLRSSAEKL